MCTYHFVMQGDTALHIAQRKSSFFVAERLRRADTSEELLKIKNKVRISHHSPDKNIYEHVYMDAHFFRRA